MIRVFLLISKNSLQKEVIKTVSNYDSKEEIKIYDNLNLDQIIEEKEPGIVILQNDSRQFVELQFFTLMMANPMPIIILTDKESVEKVDDLTNDYLVVKLVNLSEKGKNETLADYLKKSLITPLMILSKLKVEKFRRVIEKHNNDRKRKEHLEKLKGNKRAITQSGGNQIDRQERQTLRWKARVQSRVPFEILVIGASTGGPKTLKQILPKLKTKISTTLVIQHIAKGFIQNYVKKLDEQVKAKVSVAKEGDLLIPGRVYFAPDNFHVELFLSTDVGVQIKLVDKPPVNYVRPSIDVTLFSACELFGSRVVAVILTGLGKDGTEGCRVVHERGGKVLALSEADSVIYGMNKSVIEANYVDAIYDIKDMAKGINQCFKKNEVF